MNYYELVGWKNRSEGKVTKVSAERLNHMDNQILANANAIGNIEEIAGLADGTLCGAVKENKTDIETLTSNLTPDTDLLANGIIIARSGNVRNIRVANNNNTSSTLSTLSENDKPIIEQIVPIMYGESASNLIQGYAVISTSGVITLKSINGTNISSPIIRFSWSYISV